MKAFLILFSLTLFFFSTHDSFSRDIQLKSGVGVTLTPSDGATSVRCEPPPMHFHECSIGTVHPSEIFGRKGVGNMPNRLIIELRIDGEPVERYNTLKEALVDLEKLKDLNECL